MKRILTAAALLLSIAAYGQNNNKTMNNQKALVAYFSWSGNTTEIAKYIAAKTGADTFEIVTEKESNARPAIKGTIGNIDQYDVIFIGCPVWWYTGPMAMFTFMESYNFEGKTVIPFCTAYSGPSQTLKSIVEATSKSEHKDGICVVTKELGGKGLDKKHGEVDAWLKKIGF